MGTFGWCHGMSKYRNDVAQNDESTSVSPSHGRRFLIVRRHDPKLLFELIKFSNFVRRNLENSCFSTTFLEQ